MKSKTSVLLSMLLIGLFAAPVSYAEDGFFSWLLSVSRKKEVAHPVDAQHQEECGACHFPYQPGLLPQASWEKLLKSKALQDHFGDNAELDEDVRQHLMKFLTNNAADKSWFKRSRKVMASLDSGEAPMRITDVPYIKEKHSEIPQESIRQPAVKSLSFCNKCHTAADKGRYDDDTVSIPEP